MRGHVFESVGQLQPAEARQPQQARVPVHVCAECRQEEREVETCVARANKAVQKEGVHVVSKVAVAEQRALGGDKVGLRERRRR